MLSLERCRTLLGADCGLTDAQIERLRDQVRVMAEVVIDTMNGPGVSTPFSGAQRQIPNSDDDEEGAAILEFDGVTAAVRKESVMHVMKRKKR
jgi:hypothetical protein